MLVMIAKYGFDVWYDCQRGCSMSYGCCSMYLLCVIIVGMAAFVCYTMVNMVLALATANMVLVLVVSSSGALLCLSFLVVVLV